MKLFAPITNYIKEAYSELHKVTWPTRAQAIRLTIIALAITLFVALFLALWDYIFQAAVWGNDWRFLARDYLLRIFR